ncbi:hypothetical protein HYQ46_011508 [Verticillium longisporum]|nr:hypothetical protein HYQ46_011508 [Verticillium longisporum]
MLRPLLVCVTRWRGNIVPLGSSCIRVFCKCSTVTRRVREETALRHRQRRRLGAACCVTPLGLTRWRAALGRLGAGSLTDVRDDVFSIPVFLCRFQVGKTTNSWTGWHISAHGQKCSHLPALQALNDISRMLLYQAIVVGDGNVLKDAQDIIPAAVRQSEAYPPPGLPRYVESLDKAQYEENSRSPQYPLFQLGLQRKNVDA